MTTDAQIEAAKSHVQKLFEVAPWLMDLDQPIAGCQGVTWSDLSALAAAEVGRTGQEASDNATSSLDWSAAAEVGRDPDIVLEGTREGIALMCRAERNATIERCAQWHDEQSELAMSSLCCGDNVSIIAAARRRADFHIESAVAIRALADKPQPDPNVIYPGKDLTNVFPEEGT